MVSLVALLLACAPMDEQTFREEADRAACGWRAACFDEDYLTCMEVAAATWGEPDPDCFVPEQAELCVEGLDELECPGQTVEEDTYGFPSACDRVWSC